MFKGSHVATEVGFVSILMM